MTAAAHYPLDRTLVESFRADGFVNTPDVLTADELTRYTPAIDAEVATRNAADTRGVEEKSTYEQSFVQCMRLWETCPVARELTMLPKLASIAAQLLGVDGLRIWQDQALYKEPGGRETDPHQDLTFWPIGDAPIVTAWIPFDQITRGNGGMAYVPASHKAGRLQVVDITHRSTPYDILNDPALGGRAPVWVPASPGDIVWHHGLTVHEASANSTGLPRRVFTVIYLAEGFTRTADWRTFPLDRDNVGVGDVIAGPGMPVVWPPPDEMPEPPAHIGTPTGPQYR